MDRPYRVAQRQTPVANIVDYDPAWPSDFETIRGLIVACLGKDAVSVRHVGSTAVPGLAAKPIIDVDLLVPDVENEPSYLRRLESVGFRLTFRDPIAGDAHRQLTYANPNTNLHIFSVGAVEPARHVRFVDWLREHDDDRDAYGAIKRRLASQKLGTFDYNSAKSALVYDIYERIFAADDTQRHDRQPRSSVTH